MVEFHAGKKTINFSYKYIFNQEFLLSGSIENYNDTEQKLCNTS